MKPKSPDPSEKLVPQPEAHAFLERSAKEGRRVDVERAKAFALVDKGNHFLTLKCASVAEFGPHVGYGTGQARDYAAAGHVIAKFPDAEQMVLDGSMTISSLALIAPLVLDPKLRPLDEQGAEMSDAEILAWASLNSDYKLRDAVRKRRREVEAGEAVTARRLFLTAQGLKDLDRSRIIESRRQKRAVSEGATVEIALRFYLDKHDDLEKPPRKRRVPEMPERKDGTRNPRYVAADVRRELMKQHDDVCAIRYCENRIWLENSHHTPHSEGGGNELEDQDRICSAHHRLKDHGEISWVPDENDPCGGYYVGRDGQVLRLKTPGLGKGRKNAGGGPDTRADADSTGTDDAGSGLVRECVEPFGVGHAALQPRPTWIRSRRVPEGVRVMTQAEHAAC